MIDAYVAADKLKQKIRDLRGVAQGAIKFVRNNYEAQIPGNWSTMRAGLRIRITENEKKLIYSYSQSVETMAASADNAPLLAWAAKVARAKGSSVPKTGMTYLYKNFHAGGTAGGIFTRRIEQLGGPNYPGAQNPGAMEGARRQAYRLAMIDGQKKLKSLIGRPL